MQNPLRQNVVQKDSNASKSESGDAREYDQNSAQQKNVNQQVPQVIFLLLAAGAVFVFVPGDVSFVVHRAQKAARFAL